jgi:hypothetical protein
LRHHVQKHRILQRPRPYLGDILVINDLVLFALNDKTTQAILNSGANVGCDVGTSSCIVRGKSLVARKNITGAITALAKVYKTAAGVYTATASGNTFVGWTLTTLTTDGEALIVVL